MKKIYFFTLSLLCFAVFLNAQDHTVTVESNTFTPQNLTINVGESVLFDNVMGFHNVNGTQTAYPSNPESFGNGAAASAPWNYEHTFNVPGTYEYHCDPHLSLGMSGTITVVGGAAENVVISEIMYNPPESGADSLEFIEIYNNGTEAVDLNGWSLVGVTYTFDETTINPGDYIVTAVNNGAMMNLFNVTALQWENGGLSNGGELIQLVNAAGVVVDEVSYDDGGDWPVSPDGNGPSLVLCDPSADNSMGGNWFAANTATGVLIDGTEIFANPGAASGCPDNPVVSFTTDAFSVSEADDMSTVNVAISLGNANATELDIVVSAASTATANEDYTLAVSSVTFEGGMTSGMQSFDISWIDDMMPEDAETLVLEIANPTNGATLGANAVLTITIDDNDTEISYPTYTIGQVTQTNEMGEGTFVDSLVQIQGVVYGVNMRPSGLQFTIIDENNDGIGLFNNSGDLGYTVNEGDEVIVNGQIGQFNGLLQISPETVEFVDADNALFDATVVTALGEDTESQLVRIENVTLVDANDWTGSGSGFNVDVTDGTNTYVVRIDADVDLYSMEAPTGTFNVTGLGGQFDNSAPFNDGGYQLLPRYMEDIDPYNTMPPVEPSYPVYDISEVTGINAEGVADSLNTTCTLRGVVHGIDFRSGAGVQFMIHDGTDGITVFDQNIDYYNVTEGDEVIIEGSIAQFAGLTQISPDTIAVASQDNDLFGPNLVNALNEQTESEYVLVSGGLMVDADQWNPQGSGFNFDFSIGGDETISIRIDNDSPLFQLASPPANPNVPWEIQGIATQFDTESPFSDGYQLLALSITELNQTLDLSLAENIKIFPNPASEILNIQVKDVYLENIRVTDMLGRVLKDIDNPGSTLDLRLLPQGVYTITFTTEGRYYSEQFVKK